MKFVFSFFLFSQTTMIMVTYREKRQLKKITNQFEIILTGNLFPTKTGIQDKVKCKADTINQL